MIFGANTPGAPRPTGQLNSAANRRDALGRSYQPFANPFFDMASTYMPPTIKGLFQFCRYFHLTHGIVNAVVTKASEYPVTDLIFSHKDRAVTSRWDELFNGVLNYRVHQFETNLEYFVYGNAFISPSLPFTKMLKCRRCSADHQALRVRANWRYSGRGFWLSCPKCGQSDYAYVRDDYYPRLQDISLVRWNPELVSTFYNEATGRTDYMLDFSTEFKNGVQIGRKDLVATTPQPILEAVNKQRMLVFDQNAVFHMRRPGLSGMARWGIPLLLPVLKDAFFMQVMKRSQEAVLLTHMVPQVFLFPQPATAGADPFCIAPDTLVETPEGLRPAEEIRPGAYLRSHTGKWRRVEDTIRRSLGEGERAYTVTVQTMGAFPLEVSEEHPLLAVRNTTSDGDRKKQRWVEPEFIEVQHLKQYDYVAYPVDPLPARVNYLDLAEHLRSRTATGEWLYKGFSYETAEIYEYEEARGWAGYDAGELKTLLEQRGWGRNSFDHARRTAREGRVNRVPRYLEISKDLATLVGYFLAEGSITDGTVSFAFHKDEAEYHDEVERCIRSLGLSTSVTRHPHATAAGLYVRCASVLLAELLESLCGKGFATKQIPREIVDAGRERVVDMLRAMYNGDGFWGTDVRGRYFCDLAMANPHVMVEVRRLLLSFGLIGSLQKEQRDLPWNASPLYRLTLKGEQGKSLRRLLDEGPSAPRHSAPRMPGVFRDGYVLLPIKKLEPSSIKEVVGFQMYGDRSFCVPACATHNTTTSLADWRDHIRRELARQRADPGYMGILPFPLGHQVIGEPGKSLLLMPEIQAMAEHMVVGMGFPVDLIFGNGTYAGSSVNMRMLENFFMSNMQAHLRMVHWTMKHLGSFLNWPTPDARFKAFRMADDLQRTQLYMAMAQQDLISDTTLLSQVDLKTEDEAKVRLAEMSVKWEAAKRKNELMAELQGEAGVIAAKYQAQAQGALQAATVRDSVNRKSPFDAAMGSDVTRPPGVTLDAAAAALAEALKRMPPDRREAYMRQLRGSLPEMADMVAEQQGAGLPPQPDDGQGQDPQAAAQGPVDMRPQPEKLPPRRNPAVAPA